MALHLLFTLPPPAAYVDPTEPNVLVYWDDVAEAIVTFNDDHLNYTGPRVGERSPYFFCDGTTLNQFFIVSMWPYARRDETEDSPVCALVCDIFIENPLFIRNAEAGFNNGSVTVRAYSSAGGLAYSLDNSTWQFSPTFNNLEPGPKTVYIKDARECTADQAFTVQQDDLYGIRFTTSFKDSLGQTTLINILKRGYAGEQEEVRAGATPLVIKERGGEMFTVIRGQECSIALLAEAPSQYIELFTGDEREFKVEVYKDSALFWRGWLVNDVYTEPHLAPPYEMAFSATDGLGELKNTPLCDGLPSGFVLQWSLLNYIIQKLGLWLDLTSGINLYETRMRLQESDDPLTQAVVSMDAYHDGKKAWDCSAVLEAILKPYGAFIRQCNGKWDLVRVEELKSEYVRRGYNRFGAYLNNTTFNPARPITRASNTSNPFFWVDGSQTLELKPAFKQVDVHFDYKLKENLIRGGEMQEDDFEVVYSTSGAFQHLDHKWLVRPDVDAADPRGFLYDPIKPAYALVIMGSAVSSAFPDALQTERVWVQEEGTDLGIYCKFEYKAVGAFGSTNPPPQFMVSVQVNDKYLQFDSTGGTTWVSTAQSLFNPAPLNSWQTFEFAAATIPEDGWMIIRFHQIIDPNSETAYLLIKNAVCKMYKPIYPLLAKDETFTAENPRKFFITPDAIEATHGDVIPLKNAPLLYKNLIMVDGVASLDWVKRGDTEEAPILSLLADTMLNLSLGAVKVLRGSLKGYFSFDQVLQEAVTATRYMPLSFEYNDRRNTVSGEFIELLGTTSATPPEEGELFEHNAAEYNAAEYN